LPEPGPAPQPEPTFESLGDLVERLMADVLETYVSEQRFSIFSPFAEKHGSWEVVFYQPVEDPNAICRFIILNLTKESAHLSTEIWVVAENAPEKREHARYFRRLVRGFTTQDQFEFFDLCNDVTEDFRQTVTATLKEAREIVLSFKLDDLIATYPRLIPR
jgi:hypothetical protein